MLSERIKPEPNGKLLRFECSLDVYNPCVPFKQNGDDIIAGRVEQRTGNNSETVFFKKSGDLCLPIPDAPKFPLEDPFVSFVHGYLVFGGVEVDRASKGYRTVFYFGKNIYDLKPLMAGPAGMKDVRLVELSDGAVGVFTRPQGVTGGRGKIGFNTVGSLQELNAEAMINAPLIGDRFGQDSWGGVNQAILLSGGIIGVAGHAASLGEDGRKHYVATGFEFDSRTRESTKMKTLAMRENFPNTEAKRWDLEDVVFTAGLIFKETGRAEIYAGLSDVAAGYREIEWPFSQKPVAQSFNYALHRSDF